MGRWTYQAFGGLEVLEPAGRLDLGTRKQRAVLAVLLLEEGRTVSVDRLVDDVWSGAPPERAEASLHSYVSTLRRVLEPDRRPRQPAELLVRRGAGYALVVPPQDVDFRRFAQLVEQARRSHDAGDLAAAATCLEQALASYAPLLPEFEGEQWSAPDRTRLARLHRAAVRLSYDVRLQRGEHRLLEPELRAAALAEPLDEDLWSMLAVALYRSDRQGEALQAVAQCKRALADQLGVDAGPRLRRLEADLLAHAPGLSAPEPPGALAAPPTAPPAPLGTVPAQRADTASVTEPVTEAAAAAVPAPAVLSPETVGRAAELTALLRLVDLTARRARGVGVVEGEAGSGKTHLLGEVAAHAEAMGARVAWGRCSQGAGAPTLWPWVQVAGNLVALVADQEAADGGREASADADLAPLVAAPAGHDSGADPGAQFRQSEALVRLVQRLARTGPLVLVVDDVHWADEASLVLLEHLGTRLPAGVALLVGLRPAATTSGQLARTLGALARGSHHERFHLQPLGPADVAAVVEQETGRVPDEATARAIHARTGGNVFFVREVARLLLRTGRLDQAAVAGDADIEVPASVRDVVRGRLAGLPDETSELLRLAAVVGREVDLAVLAAAAELSVAETFERLGPAVDDGVLVTHPERVAWWRFAHDLVRDAVVGSTPPLRTPRLHLQVAGALERLHPERAAEPLAFHLWSAGPLADPARTAGALLRSARTALAKHAHTAAQQHLELAAGVARSAGLDDAELAAITLLTSVAAVRVGYAGVEHSWFERGEQLARRLDRPRDVGHLLYARWAAASQALLLTQSAQRVAALCEYASDHDDPVLALYAALASGIDHWDRGEIADAARVLDHASDLAAAHREEVSNDVMRFDLELLRPAFHAIVTALHGDVEASRAMLAEIGEQAVGDPYRTVVWAQFAAITESLVGDADRAIEACRRGLDVGPDSFPFLGQLILVEYWWAVAVLAVRDGAPDAEQEAAHACRELEQVVADIRRTGALTGEPGNLTLLADALMAAGRLDAAGAALDQARASMEDTGQRADEPLVLLVQARLQLALGEPVAAVRATVEQARTLSVTRGELLFVHQADALLAALADDRAATAGPVPPAPLAPA